MFILAGIAALIAAGALVAYAIKLTIKWLKKKIIEKLDAWYAKKVAVITLGPLIDSGPHTITLDELEKLYDKGYTHLMATVDDSGKVKDLEAIQDTSDIFDEKVEHFINRTGEGMVVIEGS